jgi:hypothetical protein
VEGEEKFSSNLICAEVHSMLCQRLDRIGLAVKAEGHWEDKANKWVYEWRWQAGMTGAIDFTV